MCAAGGEPAVRTGAPATRVHSDSGSSLSAAPGPERRTEHSASSADTPTPGETGTPLHKRGKENHTWCPGGQTVSTQYLYLKLFYLFQLSVFGQSVTLVDGKMCFSPPGSGNIYLPYLDILNRISLRTGKVRMCIKTTGLKPELQLFIYYTKKSMKGKGVCINAFKAPLVYNFVSKLLESMSTGAQWGQIR